MQTPRDTHFVKANGPQPALPVDVRGYLGNVRPLALLFVQTLASCSVHGFNGRRVRVIHLLVGVIPDRLLFILDLFFNIQL